MNSTADYATIRARHGFNGYRGRIAMDDNQLARVLQSAGMKCFVDWLEECKRDCPSVDIVEKMFKETNNKESSCVTKVNKIRRIIKNKQEQKALERIIISDSGQITFDIKEKARALLSQYKSANALN